MDSISPRSRSPCSFFGRVYCGVPMVGVEVVSTQVACTILKFRFRSFETVLSNYQVFLGRVISGPTGLMRRTSPGTVNTLSEIGTLYSTL
jgi:hypothetical protein